MGLRACDNPFSVLRIERVRYKSLNASIEELLGQLEKMRYRAAITGPHGSGKTTLLEDLQILLEEKGTKTRKIFINDTNPFTRQRQRDFFADLTADEIVLLDGAEQINRIVWIFLKRRILSKCAGLIITTHRAGMLATLIECSTTKALFENITGEILGEHEKIDKDICDRLFLANKGNIRNCLRRLYDIYADKNA